MSLRLYVFAFKFFYKFYLKTFYLLIYSNYRSQLE